MITKHKGEYGILLFQCSRRHSSDLLEQISLRYLDKNILWKQYLK